MEATPIGIPDPAAPTTGSTDLPCPLCGYNLRGLVEARCPECGHRFEWRELTDPELRRHPYLFEQALRRPVWSFFRTLVGGLAPWRFWREVRPTQPGNTRRLFVYWFLCALPLLMLVGLDFGLELRTAAARNRASRASITGLWNGTTRWVGGPDLDQWKEDIRRSHGSLAGFLDQLYPAPWTLRFFQAAANDWRPHLTRYIATWLAWPWLVCLVLMIFRESMQQARVRSLHVLRCIIYGYDGMFWVATAGLLFGLIVLVSEWFPPLGVRSLLDWLPQPPLDWWLRRGNVQPLASLVFWTGSLMLAFMAIRLGYAYARYLRFPHASAVVLAANFVVLLLVMLIAVQ